MVDRPPLTARQQAIFDFIVERITSCGYPPTIREIGRHLGIRSTNGVADHLKALKRKGYLRQQGQKSRTWQPIGAGVLRLPEAPATATVTPMRATNAHARTPGRAAQPAPVVPLLGRVAAGAPILAVEDIDGDMVAQPAHIGDARDIFALRVVGNSMIDDGILDGDTVYVRRRDTANAGDIAVVLIDNEATVKRYFPEGDRVRLQPANADMQPIYLRAAEGQTTRILGTVIGVWRRL
jgi:repressor LexA